MSYSAFFCTIIVYTLDLLVIGSLKPKDHCCYDICGAVIHVETKPRLYGYGNTLDLLHDSVRKYLPTKDKTGSGGSDSSYYEVILNSDTLFQTHQIFLWSIFKLNV